MSDHTYNPGEIAVRGDAISRERIQHLAGTSKRGSFVVIDVESGDYEVDTGDAAATRRLLDRRPDVVTYAVRVGHRAAYSHAKGGESGDQQVLGTIEIIDAEGRLRHVEVVLDTEFTGYLTLSAETVRQLGLPSVGRRTFQLVDGELSEAVAYQATISWHGHLTDVLVLEYDNAPLLGMTLLWGSRATLEDSTQGTAQIEALNPVASTATPPIKTRFLVRLWDLVKSWFFAILFGIFTTAMLVAIAYGTVSLPLDFGEIITFMGIWLAIGVLLGQNKPPAMPLFRYLGRRVIGIVCCYALFIVITVVYVSRSEVAPQEVEGKEIFGLIVLSLVSFATGFFAGQDKEPNQ